MRRTLSLLAIAVFIAGAAATVTALRPTSAEAHPGRTDSSGCHTCRTNCPSWGLRTGEYHCHGPAPVVPLPAVTATPPPPPTPQATETPSVATATATPAASTPARTTPQAAGTPRATATPRPPALSTANSRAITAKTMRIVDTTGEGVAQRHRCSDTALFDRPGLADGTVVRQVRAGRGSCAGWSIIEYRGVRSWVRDASLR